MFCRISSLHYLMFSIAQAIFILLPRTWLILFECNRLRNWIFSSRLAQTSVFAVFVDESEPESHLVVGEPSAADADFPDGHWRAFWRTGPHLLLTAPARVSARSNGYASHPIRRRVFVCSSGFVRLLSSMTGLFYAIFIRDHFSRLLFTVRGWWLYFLPA